MACKIGHEITKRLKFRKVQIGALAYRNKLHKLSGTAQRIVFRLEAGSTLIDIIDCLAWQHYHTGKGNHLLPSEIRAAQVEAYHCIQEIKAVFFV